MNVLPYRARRFIRHNLSWNNIRFQWITVGITLFVITNLLASQFPGITKLPICIIGGWLSGQFFLAAIFFPAPKDYNWVIRKYDDLGRWWRNVAMPGYYGQSANGGGLCILRPVFCDFTEVYDLNGNLIGCEQDVWSDGVWIFTPTKKPARLPTIALWRTKQRKPIGLR